MQVESGDVAAEFREVASPELYRRNAFRVTGLPVDVSARELRRHSERLKVMEGLGGRMEVRPGALPLEPASDWEATRTAMQRLREPERRLVDEFFWFWPTDSEDDKAFTALERGDVEGAVGVWEHQAEVSPHAGTAVHNLAVLWHLRALDIEHANRLEPPGDEGTAIADECWHNAFSWWQRLDEGQSFWSALNDRIRQLADPRLTTGMIRRMRTSLPLALMSINAYLAVQAAENGHPKQTRRQLGLMASSGFSADDANEALRLAVQPVADRLKHLCKNLDHRADADSSHGRVLAEQLLAQTTPLLGTVDRVLPPGHAIRDGIHDEVALSVFSCVIGYYNETEDSRTSLRLLRAARSIAVGNAAIERFDQNIAIIERNSLVDDCWFCQGQSDAEVSVPIKMYGNVNNTGFRLEWQTITVKVPRCGDCESGHSRERIFGSCAALIVAMGTWAAFALGGYVGQTWFGGDSKEFSGWWGLVALLLYWAFAMAVLVSGWRYYRRNGTFAPRSRAAARYFPTVQELWMGDWFFGDGPPTSRVQRLARAVGAMRVEIGRRRHGRHKDHNVAG